MAVGCDARGGGLARGSADRIAGSGVRGEVLAALLVASLVVAPESEALVPMPALVGGTCEPPFRGVCPPSGQTPRCEAEARARSRDRTVVAEVVRDGVEVELLAMHLVVRTGADRWVLRKIGERGVACATLEMSAARFEVVELRVADVLFGPRPEVILRTRDGTAWQRGGVDDLTVCTTDTSPPRCMQRPVPQASPRFARRGRVRVGDHVYRVEPPAP